MEFFKSAVASAISKGPAFPFSFGEKVELDHSVWELYNGTKRVSCNRLYYKVNWQTLNLDTGGWVEM